MKIYKHNKLGSTVINIKSISSGLILGEDGIWYGLEKQKISYPSDGNNDFFNIEDSSFWFKHRNSCISCVVKKYPPEKNGPIFDIGGGNGFVSLGLINAGFDVVLVEPGQMGASNAKRVGLENVICSTIYTARFKPKCMPSIGLFDVLEHIEDDLSFLKTIRDLIKEQGRLYLTVPSFNFLWSKEDVLAGHFRRYTLKNICKKLETAGFEIDFSSYIFRLLPAPIFLFRTLPFRAGLSNIKHGNENISRDHVLKAGAVTRFFDAHLRSEVHNIKEGKTMRFGGSCLIVARNS